MTQRDTNGRGRKEQPAAQARDRERPDEPKPSKKEQRWAKKAPEMIEIPRSEERATLAAMMGMKPQDELEGMLIGQLIASHNAAMECYRRAMIGDQTFEGRRENLNQANKLSRTSAALTEALDRHRGKGQQRITVEHVNVHAGGQAIVGAVTPKGGSSQKSEQQTHATREITHEPGIPMRSPDPERETMPIASGAGKAPV